MTYGLDSPLLRDLLSVSPLINQNKSINPKVHILVTSRGFTRNVTDNSFIGEIVLIPPQWTFWCHTFVNWLTCLFNSPPLNLISTIPSLHYIRCNLPWAGAVICVFASVCETVTELNVFVLSRRRGRKNGHVLLTHQKQPRPKTPGTISITGILVRKMVTFDGFIAWLNQIFHTVMTLRYKM